MLAAATIWLFVTNPVTVATAVNEGEVSPLVRSLADVLISAFSGLLRPLLTNVLMLNCERCNDGNQRQPRSGATYFRMLSMAWAL